MPVSTHELTAICRIGHDSSMRGAGRALRDLLDDANYAAVRPHLTEAALGAHLAGHPELAEQWLAYSEDKRTSGGWYLVKDDSGWDIGRVDPRGRLTDKQRHADAQTACAAYILRELDFWITVGHQQLRGSRGRPTRG